jgi:hypothetical protein
MTSRAALLAFIAALPAAASALEPPANMALAASKPTTITIELQGRESLRLGRHFRAEAEPLPAGPALARGVQREQDLQPRGAAYGVAFLPISPKADVFARAGYGASDLRESPGRGFEGGWKLGFGAHYSPNANADVRADFTHHDVRTSRIKANILSFGYARRF